MDHPQSHPLSEQQDHKALQAATEELRLAVGDFLTKSDTSEAQLDAAKRLKVINAAEKILATVKEPIHQWLDMSAHTVLITASRLFSDWGAFDAIPAEGSISYDDLAEEVNAEASLLARVGGVLVSRGVLHQIGMDQVAHTPRSRAFTKGQPVGMLCKLAWETGLVTYVSMPRFFEAYGRKETQTLTSVPSTFAIGHPEWTFYEMLARDPERLERFTRGMSSTQKKQPIAEIYDFGWVVSKAKEEPHSDRILFVDVGGGAGQAIKAIRAEFPGLPLNRCMLQDRAEVIETAKTLKDPELEGVQTMAIDFHKEQPLKNALIYWVRHCLVNHPDSMSSSILEKIADSMAEDSKILIQEDIMDSPPTAHASSVDFMMLGIGGKQRTLQCWEKVISQAGLKISGISRPKSQQQHAIAVIECVKAK
ncbi:Demethylsterigmatocystin 6-O-methyltransferase 1 [Colletotrichum chlorophyti]|uniref:Demethylsterigmatocystin 6-O-methyltransferase 1 n=1 Tax=Colletotrichum chlorophyti TaxID=708187 RepID=A0A1Q8S7U4_9PEZI|nr:Demethylsterigmatocystin 6-O-methyltransferase 1 [Colletotrichum chlorophyti]